MPTKFKTIILYSIFCIFSTNCASIMSQADKTIYIKSNPEGARATITDEENKEIFIAKTPAITTLTGKKGYMTGKTYKVLIQKEGFKDQIISIESNVIHWYIWGNMFAFIPVVGYFIDPTTGAMWELEPQDINVMLEPLDATKETEKPPPVSASQ